MATTADTPRIAWTQHGDGGSPVLMIMGFAMRGVVWQPQLAALSAHHRVVTYDNRGIGDSEGDGRLWTMAELADDARRVLDAAGFDRAHVVGASMGGMIAQELALRHPGRVASLSLIVTHGGGRGTRPSGQGLVTLAQTLAGSRQRKIEALERLLYPPEYLASVDRDAFRAQLRTRTGYQPSRRVLAGQLAAVARHATLDRLGAIDAPTLVVRAGRDILLHPDHSHRLVAAIPGARLLDFPEAGHGVIHQCAAPLNAALLGHFGGEGVG